MSGGKLRELEQSFVIEKKKRPNLSFASFVSERALIEIERRNLLKEAAFISLAAAPDGNSAFLRDTRKENKSFEVQIRPDKKLRCIQDKGNDCIHVGFALALTEVRRAFD